MFIPAGVCAMGCWVRGGGQLTLALALAQLGLTSSSKDSRGSLEEGACWFPTGLVGGKELDGIATPA